MCYIIYWYGTLVSHRQMYVDNKVSPQFYTDKSTRFGSFNNNNTQFFCILNDL